MCEMDTKIKWPARSRTGHLPSDTCFSGNRLLPQISRRPVFDRYLVAYRAVEKPRRLGACHAGQHKHVEEFSDLTPEPDPLDNVTIARIDNLHATPRFAIPLRKFIIKRKAGEAAIPRQRKPHKGIRPMKGKATRKARQEGDILPLARLLVHTAQRADAGIEHPERAIMHARRMWHGKIFRHHAVITHIHDEAARSASVPPSGNDIAPAHRRDIARLS